MESDSNSESPKKKCPETNVASTEMMDTEDVSSIKESKTKIELEIPPEQNIGSDFDQKIVLEENGTKEVVTEPPIKENGIKEKIPEEEEVFADTKIVLEFGIGETEASTSKESDIFSGSTQEKIVVPELPTKENIIIGTVSEKQDVFADTNVPPEFGISETVLPSYDQIHEVPIFYTNLDLLEAAAPYEIVASTSRQLDSVDETCGDFNPNIILKGDEFPDIKTYQKISDSSGDAGSNVTLSENEVDQVISVYGPIQKPEPKLVQDVEKQQIGDSPIRENVVHQRPEMEPAESVLEDSAMFFPQTAFSTSEEYVVPNPIEYLMNSSGQQVPGVTIRPFTVSLQPEVNPTNQPDVLPGTSRETRPRQSFLRNFDPLLSNSPNRVTTALLQDVLNEIQVIANSPALQPVNGTIQRTGILIDLGGIVIPDQEGFHDSVLHEEELVIPDIITELENQEEEETTLIFNTTTELEKQEVEETKESVGTQTTDEHKKKRARHRDSHESLRVHCNDSSQSFNEDFFEAQSVLQRHIARSLKGFVDFGPREESDIEGRVFEIEPQVYEDESELSKTPVRNRSPSRRKIRKHESSGEETHQDQPTQPPKYLHVLEKQRRDIQVVTSDSETDIEIEKKKVSINDDLNTTKEVSEKVKHHDEPSKKKKTPEKAKLPVAPHRNSVSEEQGDKVTKKIVKDNKLIESERSSYKETSESEHGRVRATKKFVKKKGDVRVEIDTNKEEEKLSEPPEEECALEEKYLKPFVQTLDITALRSKMADLSEKLNQQQQENSELKLQLNASQQAKAQLELEIRQKEEIIIKTQAEALKNEQVYKQELKQLKEKLKENSKLIEKDTTKELEEQLKEAKLRELRAAAELAQRNNNDDAYRKTMDKYESTLKYKYAENQKLAEELNSVKTHLSNLELAFSDVHLKYEKTKESLEGYKSIEETLLCQLNVAEQTNVQQEEKYESLMVHAKSQIERSNRENLALVENFEGEINKLNAIIKRLEIKCSSLESTLQQKTAECEALSALCAEVTGKKV